MLPTKFVPKQKDNKMKHEGDVFNARKVFFKKKNSNLKFLLRTRYDWINKQIDNYINEFLHDAFWFTKWNNKSHFHYIKYPTNTGMETHCDHVRHTFDGEQRGIPILSIIGTFNGDYKGGELLFLPDTKIRLNKGEVVIFPSNFLYPHKLLQITEGVRYSFIVWVW